MLCSHTDLPTLCTHKAYFTSGLAVPAAWKALAPGLHRPCLSASGFCVDALSSSARCSLTTLFRLVPFPNPSSQRPVAFITLLFFFIAPAVI